MSLNHLPFDVSRCKPEAKECELKELCSRYTAIYSSNRLSSSDFSSELKTGVVCDYFISNGKQR